jgi:hypothetical protein
MLPFSIWSPTCSGPPVKDLRLDIWIIIDSLVGALIFSRCCFTRVCREVSLSYRCHGTCLRIGLYDIDGGGESHGDWDWGSSSYGGMVFWLRWRLWCTCFSCVSGVWCLVLAALVRGGDSIGGPYICGTPWVPSHIFWMWKSKSGLYWFCLYLTMALLKTLFWELELSLR